MNRLLREPLLHFLVLGAVLFAVYGWMGERTGDPQGRIVVTRGQIEQLETGFSRTWRRPPTAGELNGLIRDHIREEVYYREAVAMGLERDDTIIRRRLQQKLEFISDDVAAQAEPSDADLVEFLRSHPDKFRRERSFTFSHVYLNPEHHRGTMTSDAAQLFAALNTAGAGADFSMLGDSFLLESSFEALPANEVAKLFGETFAGKLDELSAGQWQGPIESGFGQHLVIVSARTDGRVPALQEVREAVLREWANVQRKKASEDFFQSLLSHYRITVEGPPAAATAAPTLESRR